MPYMTQGFVEELFARPGEQVSFYAARLHGTAGSVAALVRELWGYGLVQPDPVPVSGKTRVRIEGRYEDDLPAFLSTARAAGADMERPRR